MQRQISHLQPLYFCLPIGAGVRFGCVRLERRVRLCERHNPSLRRPKPCVQGDAAQAPSPEVHHALRGPRPPGRVSQRPGLPLRRQQQAAGSGLLRPQPAGVGRHGPVKGGAAQRGGTPVAWGVLVRAGLVCAGSCSIVGACC